MGYGREDIDKVRERTDLAELAAEVTKVKRSGRTVMAVCPFHDEKTPSLSLDPARGLYHCFGCGKSGDVFTWVQETQSVDFVGALELLARRTGVTLTETAGEQRRRGRREVLISAVTEAMAFYHERLRTAPEAADARRYLRSRGYEADVVEHFGIGYAPTEWDQLVRHLRDRGHPESVIQEAGLGIRSRRGSTIDLFRGRVVFPIRDLRGDPVGFGARLLDGDGPKYLNTPETPIYHKSQLLYGLDRAKSDIVRRGEAVVVEGYTDVIAFHLAGRPVAVATCGTALGDDHLGLLRRFSERIVLAFDADEAGAGAALRGFDRAILGDLDLRVAALPQGRDPADLVHNGDVDVLGKAIDDSVPLLEFRIEREIERYDLTEPEARGKAAAAAAKLVALHPSAAVREEYAEVIAYRTGIERATVERAVAGAPAARREPSRRTEGPRRSGQELAERELLRLVMANDPRIRQIEIETALITDETLRRGYELVTNATAHLDPGVAPPLGAILADADEDVASILRPIAAEDRPLANTDDIVAKIKVGAIDRRRETLRVLLAGLNPETDPQGYSDTFQELIALESQRRELQKGGR